MTDETQKKEIENIVIDFTERRLESAIATFNGLFLSHKREVAETVQTEIKKTVNGKIDNLREENKKYHEKQQVEINDIKNIILEMKEVVDELKDVSKAKQGLKILGKFVLWFSGVGGAIIGLFKLLKL